jgi:hypothetical protein
MARRFSERDDAAGRVVGGDEGDHRGLAGLALARIDRVEEGLFGGSPRSRQGISTGVAPARRTPRGIISKVGVWRIAARPGSSTARQARSIASSPPLVTRTRDGGVEFLGEFGLERRGVGVAADGVGGDACDRVEDGPGRAGAFVGVEVEVDGRGLGRGGVGGEAREAGEGEIGLRGPPAGEPPVAHGSLVPAFGPEGEGGVDGRGSFVVRPSGRTTAPGGSLWIEGFSFMARSARGW